ncbi:ubiquitin carboxyl-terminal hydrolase 36 isoform X1 [Tropilaelaps mercedesae]|uniref:Ubiquitin carboxyl-terminal hydrolase 36 isoform X1 n=1 Tax=Tropilaelaps mercedesae TaxID=418985 RepID=A0A1V9Y1M2_9ACAR|nr:ubiquitin carboxyl-terminal hydrolase 36 isoform X1 [Tropilaelaps mercedesae]
MEALVTTYLSKKLSPAEGLSTAPFKTDSLESQSRIHGLLSGGITFTRSGPQNDPWLDILAKMPCKVLSLTGPTHQQRLSQADQTSRSTATSWNLLSTPGTASPVTFGKPQKRPLEVVTSDAQQGVNNQSKQQQQAKLDRGPGSGNASKTHPVVLRNSGSRVQVGLTNVGNTCYFNAMLQCLTNCKPFYNYIRSETHDRNICKRGDQCVLCLLKSFCVSQMPVNPNEKIVSGNVLRDLLVKMRTAVRRWKIHAHQSVDEILSYVLDSMWEKDMVYFGVTDRQHTPMMGLFGTLVEQQYACSLCGQASISTVVEPTIILGLVNGDRRSVQDRLRMEYGLTETLSEPKSKCDACGQSRTPRPTMKRVLKNLPMILVVMLKRFYVIDGISHKINQFVQFPESLDLRPCMDTSGTTQNSLYRLSGVVEHWGKSVTDGHYVAYCKNYCTQRRTEAWFCLNDRQVRTIDSREVLQKQAYLLFYTVQGQATRTIDTLCPPRALVGNNNGDFIGASTTQGLREAKIAKISPTGQHTLKVTKLIPSKYVPIVVLKKTNGDKNGVCSNSAASLNSSTQVVFSKSLHQKTTCLPFVNGNGPAALKLPIVKININGNSQLNRVETGHSGRDSVSCGTTDSPTSETTCTAPGMDLSSHQPKREGNHRTASSLNSSVTRQSVFGNLSPKLGMSRNDKISQNQRRADIIRSSLVPYASSSDDGSSDETSDGQFKTTSCNSTNSNSTLKRGVVSALHFSIPRAASSSGWVVDKLNDTPSVNSNSSSQHSSNGSGSCCNTNSSVHGTSLGWSVTQEAHSTPSSSSSQIVSSSILVDSNCIRGSKTPSSSNGSVVNHISSTYQGTSQQANRTSVNNSPERQTSLNKTPTSVASSNGVRSSVPTIAYMARVAPLFQAQQSRNTSKPDEFSLKTEGNDSNSSTPVVPSVKGTRSLIGGAQRNSQSNNVKLSRSGSKGGLVELSKDGLISSGNEDDSVHRDGNPFSYWGAKINESKGERALYDEEIDQGRQKKKTLSWKNQTARWGSKPGHRGQHNPFQREQDQRHRSTSGIPGILHNARFKKQQHRPNHHHFISATNKQKIYQWHRNGNKTHHGANGHHANINREWSRQNARNFR